jgi:hypothetical protein
MAKTVSVVAALAVIWTVPAVAMDWTGYASIGTDYIYRGVSLLDSGPAVQGGVEGRFADNFIVGASAVRIDRQWLYSQDVPDHVQLDFYAGADFGCGPYCRARVLVSRYEFPGPDTRDWTEGTASVEFFDRLGISYSWSPEGLGSSIITRTTEAWLQQPFSLTTSAELGYGRVVISRFNYWYAHVGVSHRIGRFVFGLTQYVGDPGLKHLLFDGHSNRLVLTVSTAF